MHQQALLPDLFRPGASPDFPELSDLAPRGGRRGAAGRLGHRPVAPGAGAAGERVAIGDRAEPYAEAELAHTRELLRALESAEGLTVELTTRSPLVAGDAARLARIDARNAVTVRMILPTVDPELAPHLEKDPADPADRLRAITRLAASGLGVTVLCRPLMPWINSEEEVLRPLFRAARNAGARDVEAVPFALSAAARPRLLPWLRQEYPELMPQYRKLYGRRGHLARGDRERFLATFRRLRLEHGFPRATAGRG